MKVALVGTGQMARIYGQLLRERRDIEFCGVIGHSESTTRALAADLGIDGYPGSGFDGLRRDRGPIDAYLVAVPEWIRLGVLSQIFPGDAHVLLEKPLATSLEELAAIERLAGARGRDRITVAHSLRFSPRFSQLKRALSAGRLGELRHIYSRRNPSSQSVRRVLGKFPLAYWLSCHDVDLIRWFAGSEVQSVSAVSRGRLDTEDDYIIAHLHLANGVDAVHEVSWCAPPLSMNAPTCYMYMRGTAGMVEINDSDMGIDLYGAGDAFSSEDTYEMFPIAGKSYGIFQALVETWITGISAGTPAYPSFEDAAAAIRVCAMIDESIRTGLKVVR